MVTNNRIYIHLGLHKTGTTFFQKNFYPSYPEFNYKHLRASDVLADFNQYILRENELTFNLNKASELFYQNLSKEATDKGILTLCEEQFSGFPLQNAYNRKLIFDRLNRVFPNANYILVLRNQNDFVKSMYAEYLKKGGTATLKCFLERNDSQINFARGTYLKYFTYYNYIKSQVSENQIKVLYYEDLKYNPDLFMKKLLNFFNLEIQINLNKINNKKNASFEEKKFEAVRFYNLIGKTTYGKDNLIPKKFKNFIVTAHQVIKKNNIVSEKIIADFVEPLKKDNLYLPEYSRVKEYGY